MPHAPMPWVKLYTSRLDDVRFNRLPEPLKWRWAQLTLLAGKLDAGGTFVLDGVPMTDDEIAWQLRLELERWQDDSEALKASGYLVRNGHGWQLTDWMDSQGPDGKHAEQREQWRERQERHRNKKSVTGDTPVSHASKSLESESESRVREDKSQSQSVISRELLKISGISQKYWDRLTDISSGLTTDDFLAELARNYSRAGDGQGKVRNPPHITAMNLTNGDRAQAHWYTVDNWLEYVPQRVLQTARPDLFEEIEIEGDTVDYTGFTKSWLPENRAVEKTVHEAWDALLDKLEQAVGPLKSPERGNFETFVKPTKPIHYDGKKLFIGVRNSVIVDRLNENGFPAQALEIIRESLPDLTEIVITLAGETEAEE